MAASPVGASHPVRGLASCWRGGGESQAFPVYVTHRPSRKGKGLESALLLGKLQRELRIASLQEALANPNPTPGCVGIQHLDHRG